MAYAAGCGAYADGSHQPRCCSEQLRRTIGGGSMGRRQLKRQRAATEKFANNVGVVRPLGDACWHGGLHKLFELHGPADARHLGFNKTQRRCHRLGTGCRTQPYAVAVCPFGIYGSEAGTVGLTTTASPFGLLEENCCASTRRHRCWS